MICPKCKAEYREGFIKCADCGIDLVPELPPEPREEYVDLVSIRSYSDRHEAELARSFLVSNGVKAVLSPDDCAGLYPSLSLLVGIRLLVDKDDVETAENILSQEGTSEDIVEEELSEVQHTPTKKRRFPSFFLGLVIGVVISGVAFVIYIYDQKHRSGVQTYDLNKDSKADLFYYYENGIIVRTEQDRNFDGKIDEWCFFKDGVVERCESDDGFNGRIGTVHHFKNGIATRSDIYANNANKPAIVVHYTNGVIAETWWYHESTGRIWKRRVYVNGIMNEEYIDQDYDGTFDIKIIYNSWERPIDVIKLTKPGTRTTH